MKLRAIEKDDVLQQIANQPRNKFGAISKYYIPKTKKNKDIVEILANDYMVSKTAGDYGYSIITSKGIELLNNGGYTAIAPKEIEVLTEQNNIRNTEARLKIKSLKREQWIAPAAIMISSFSLIVAIIGLIVSLRNAA